MPSSLVYEPLMVCTVLGHDRVVSEQRWSPDSACRKFQVPLSKNHDENPHMRALLVRILNFAHARILVTIFGQRT